MTDEDSRLLHRVAQQLSDSIESQKQMHEENKARFGEDRQERRIWRESIDQRFDGIERRIGPVVLSHTIITKGGKWVVAAVGVGAAMVKSWLFVKDHLKP